MSGCSNYFMQIGMDYQLLEEIECPTDLFVIEDDMSYPRVGDFADPVTEFHPSEEEQNPLRWPCLLAEKSISPDLPAHDKLNSFRLGDNTSPAHTLCQARSPFQATFESSLPADEDMRYQLLEEIECPKDLFAFDDDLSNSRLNETSVLKESLIGVEHLPVINSDTAVPAVEHGSSDEQQRGPEESSPAMKTRLGASSGSHEEHDELPPGSGIPLEQSAFQGRLFSQTSLHTLTPIRESGAIEEQDMGRRVAVVKIGVGVLRYVGSVKGKEGIFCGVELDLPQGRHNGTYQGIAYFQCADKHGIFAPPHRVRLLIEMPEPSQRVRGEAAMRDPDGSIARKRKDSVPVCKKLKSTLESVAAKERLPKEYKSKLPVMYAGDDARLMKKTHKGGPWKHVIFPAATAAVPAVPASEGRLKNKLLKTANASILIAASSCSTAPRPKQRRLSPSPTIFSHKVHAQAKWIGVTTTPQRLQR
uniref:CAP-Gly domain-containing protein n=1 Tax=Parascaris univalens TaxID=6257 RepID=A0A915C7U4_PARUN